MKGEFSRSTFSARMRYGNVATQQGRVQLDTDWNEKAELQLHRGLVYLDVWERDATRSEDGSLSDAALGGTDTGSRRRDSVSGVDDLRLTREVSQSGTVSSMLHAALGKATGRKGQSFALPELEISVEGSPWRRVRSLSKSGPQDNVYVVTEDGERASVAFGDGKNGSRPAAGARIVASYRFASSGNAPDTSETGGSSRP